jgi:hypothetical protein
MPQVTQPISRTMSGLRTLPIGPKTPGTTGATGAMGMPAAGIMAPPITGWPVPGMGWG